MPTDDRVTQRLIPRRRRGGGLPPPGTSPQARADLGVRGSRSDASGDELGFVPFDHAGGELLFNLPTDRYERRSTIVTTNLAFAEWVTVFAGDEKLTTALLDRLAHHRTVLTTKGESCRMRKRRTEETRGA